MPRVPFHRVLDTLQTHALEHEQAMEEDEHDAHGDPWHFLRGRWTGDANGLDHDNFTHDMALQINGDFASSEQRLQTVQWIARRLNGETVDLAPWCRGTWQVEIEVGTVFHRNPERDIGLRLTGDFGHARRQKALQGLARLLNGLPLPTV